MVDALVSGASGFAIVQVRVLFWAPQIAVNHLIFSYFYFVNKQQISNFQHIICFCTEIGLLGMYGNAHNFAAVYPNNTSEASTDCGSLALSVLNDC